MSGTLSPSPWFTGFSDSGDIVSGGKLFTYVAGTTTKVTTYSDVDLLVPHTNPIILDSAGRATIYLSAGSYKFVLSPANDTDPPTNPIRTQDNIAAVGGGAGNGTTVNGTAATAISAGQVVYQTATGWLLGDSSAAVSSTNADAIGIATAAIASSSQGSIQIEGEVTGLSGLVAGTTYYVGTAGALTSSPNVTYTRAVGQASSATSIILSSWTRGAIQPTRGISANTTQVDGINGTVNLMTYTVPANTLVKDGQALKVHSFFICANNATAKSIACSINGFAGEISCSFGVNSLGSMYIDFTLTRTDSTHYLFTGWGQSVKLGSATLGFMEGFTAGPRVFNPAATFDIIFSGTGGAAADVSQTLLEVTVCGYNS